MQKNSAIMNMFVYLKIQFSCFAYFILRRYFKRYFVLEDSKVKLTYIYIIHKEFSIWLKFWTVRTMGNKWEAKHDDMYVIKRALKGKAGKHITYVFVLCSFGKFSWRIWKVMTCLFPNSLSSLTGSPPTIQIPSSKWSQKAHRWPFTSLWPLYQISTSLMTLLVNILHSKIAAGKYKFDNFYLTK